MNCPDFEKLIALYVEDDLPERKAADLEAHLKACRSCQEFAEKLQASQSLLKSLGQESVDEAALQEVRRRVLDGIASGAEPPRFPAWRLALGAALAAAAIFAAVTLWRPRAPEQRRVWEISEQAPAQAVPSISTASEHARVRTEKAKHALRQRRQSQGSLTASVHPPQLEQLTVKLITDDPNVVIYWLVD